MDNLERYYNERFKEDGDIPFNELRLCDKLAIRGTTGFVFYELGLSVDGIRDGVSKFVKERFNV